MRARGTGGKAGQKWPRAERKKEEAPWGNIRVGEWAQLQINDFFLDPGSGFAAGTYVQIQQGPIPLADDDAR